MPHCILETDLGVGGLPLVVLGEYGDLGEFNRFLADEPLPFFFVELLPFLGVAIGSSVLIEGVEVAPA